MWQQAQYPKMEEIIKKHNFWKLLMLYYKNVTKFMLWNYKLKCEKCKIFYTFKIDHQICLTVKREQTQLHQIMIFDLKEISAEAGLLELSAEIVPIVCTRFREANHRTTSSFLRDGVSHDIFWRPICILAFYRLIQLVNTRVYRSLPHILVYPHFILILWVVQLCKL